MARRSRLPWLVALAALGAAAWFYRDELRTLLPPAERPPPAEKPAARAQVKPRKQKVGGASLRGAEGRNPEVAPLVMPDPKPCLDPPTGADLPEQGLTASRGLDPEEVRAAMSAVVVHALACFADADSGTMTLSVVAGCDGVVSDITVQDAGGFPTDVTGCVAETLRHAAFPAHDLPGGYAFLYPVTYTAP